MYHPNVTHENAADVLQNLNSFPDYKRFRHIIKAMAEGKGIVMLDNGKVFNKGDGNSGFSFCYSPSDYKIVGSKIKLITLRVRA